MLAKHLVLHLLIFPSSQVHRYHLWSLKKFKNWNNFYSQEIIEVLDAILCSKVLESYLVECVLKLLTMIMYILRVRAFFHKTVRICHVYCNFKIGFTCWITVIFGTLKDESPLINTLASNICFSYRNMFQNGVDALSKIVDAFLSKSSKFHLVRIIR